MADSSQSVIDQLNSSMLGPQSGSTGPQATAADFLPSLQQADQQALGNISSPQTSNPLSNSGGLFDSSSWTTGWNSLEDNPITRNIVSPVMNTAAGVTNMFSAMAPDPNESLSQAANPLDPFNKAINAFWQGYNDPTNTPLGKEDSAWRSLLGNSLDPHGAMQDPFQSIQQGWNNPNSAPNYRTIANDFLTQGKDIPYLSDVLGVGASLINPINKVAIKAPFAEDAGLSVNPSLYDSGSGYRSDLQGAYQSPETVGSMPKTPLDQQPFNVLSSPPDMNVNTDSLSNLSRIWDQSPTDIQANVQSPNSPYLNEFNQALQDEFNRLKDIRNNPPGMLDKGGLTSDNTDVPYQGGEITGSFKPTSGNPQWYRDFYNQFDRKPTNNELMSIAKDNLLNGEKDSYFGDTPAWKPQAAQDLESQMNQISDMIQNEKDPATLQSLGKTLDALQQEHDNIVSEAQNQIQQGYKPTVNTDSSINDMLDGIFGKESAASLQSIEHPGVIQSAEMRVAPNKVPNLVNEAPKEIPTTSEVMPSTDTNPYYGKTFGMPWEKYTTQGIKNPILNVVNKIGDLPGVRNVKDVLGRAFVKNYGASPELTNILDARNAENAANHWNIIQNIKNMANHGLNKDEYNDIGHVIEKTKEGSDKQNEFISKFQNLKDNGISDSTGTNALTSTYLNGNPLLAEESLLDNHFNHMYRNVPNELKGVFPKRSPGGGLSPTGEFAMPRTFGTLQEAMDAGLKPVTDPLQVLGEHLSQTSKAVTNARALNDIMNTPGLLFDKAKVDEITKLVKTGRMTTEEAANTLGMSVDELKKGFTQSSIPQLSNYYIRPRDEAAIRAYLDHVDKSTAYDKVMGYWKKGTVFNSFVHLHNVLYNGAYLGGANLKYAWQTFKNLKDGVNDVWHQRALKDGAISADKGAFLDNLEKAVKQPNALKEKVAWLLHGALWDADQALRTAIYREAVEKGATGEQAAARANKFLIDYNNLTPFEEKWMTRIFPFYRWVKGNIPLQAEQWLTNTPKQALYHFGNMYAAQALTGQNADEEGRWDIGTLPDGEHIKADWYAPEQDIHKIASKGILPYLYGATNPLLKELADQVSNKAYYPTESVAPNGKEGMANSTIRNDQAPLSYNAERTAAHVLSNFLPALNVKGIPVGMLLNVAGNAENNGGAKGLVNDALGGQTKDKTPTQPSEYITKALGGFTTRDNPLMDQYFQQKNQQDNIKQHMKYEQQIGQKPSKQEMKDAYKKLKYPAAQ